MQHLRGRKVFASSSLAPCKIDIEDEVRSYLKFLSNSLGTCFINVETYKVLKKQEQKGRKARNFHSPLNY